MEVLSKPSEQSIILMMYFMHSIEEREGVEESMSPIEEKILNHVDKDDLNE